MNLEKNSLLLYLIPATDVSFLFNQIVESYSGQGKAKELEIKKRKANDFISTQSSKIYWSKKLPRTNYASYVLKLDFDKIHVENRSVHLLDSK